LVRRVESVSFITELEIIQIFGGQMKIPDNARQRLIDLVSELARKTVVELWGTLSMDTIFGTCKNRPQSSLARDFIDRYGTRILAKKEIRNALLRGHGKPSAKLRQLRGINGNSTDWPNLLFPRWVSGGRWAHEFCRAFDLDPAFAGEPLPEKMPTIELLRQPEPPKPLMLFQTQLRNKIEQCARPRSTKPTMPLPELISRL
jgi:hypothetical protein